MTLNDKLEAFFRECPNVWIDGMALAKVAGSYAWRSRCADLRKRGMVIENRQQRHTDAEGRTWVVSWYMFVPERVAQDDKFDANAEWQLSAGSDK